MNSPPSDKVEGGSVLNGERSRRKTSNYDSLRQDLELFMQIWTGASVENFRIYTETKILKAVKYTVSIRHSYVLFLCDFLFTAQRWWGVKRRGGTKNKISHSIFISLTSLLCQPPLPP